MLTDKQIADALDLIDGRYHDVITKYLRKVGKTINEIGHLNASSVNLLMLKVTAVQPTRNMWMIVWRMRCRLKVVL